VTDRGIPFVAGEFGLLTMTTDGKTSAMLDLAMASIQVDASGAQLVAGAQDGSVFLINDAGRATRLEGTIPPGTPQWFGKGTLAFSRERVLDFNASTRERIQVSVMGYRLEDGGWFRPDVSTENSSGLGTLPTIPAIWHHPLSPHRILAMPAPLELLSSSTPPIAITAPGPLADVGPTATRQGELFFVRTARRIGRAGTALRLEISREGAHPYPISDGLVDHVAISPNGEQGALITAGPNATMRLFTRESLLADAPGLESAYAEQQQAFAALQRIHARLERRFEQLAGPGGIIQFDWGTLPKAFPKEAIQTTMAGELRGALAEELGCNLRPGIEGLADLEAILHYPNLAWPESPGVLVASGAIIAEAIPNSRWIAATEDHALGADEKEGTHRDVSFAAVLPHALVRNALANRSPIVAPILALARVDGVPIYLAENLRQESQHRIQEAELRRAGLTADSTVEDLVRFATSEAGNLPAVPLVTLNAISVLRESGDRQGALRQARRLLLISPSRVDALPIMATALFDAGELDAALRCFQLAAEFQPDEAGIRFQLADALLTLNRLAEARAEFQLTLLLQPGSVLATEHVPSRLKLISELESEEQ
jgi:tetratricopeptide (TPR) repeat protein